MHKIKKLFFLSFMVFILGVIGIPSTANAAQCHYGGPTPWLHEANCTTNRSTVYTFENAALRVGYYKGIQYGWGKIYPGRYAQVRFEVDLNGDRRPDTSSGVIYIEGVQSYTEAYPTASSSKRAFRICVEDGKLPRKCGPWW